MRKTLILIALIIALPAATMAMPGSVMKRCHGGEGSIGPLAQFFNLLDKLEISTEQLIQLRELHKAHKAKMKTLFKDLKQVGGELRDQLRGDPKEDFNAQTALELGSKRAGLMKDLFMTKITYIVSLRKILTPEQVKKLRMLSCKKQMMRRKFQQKCGKKSMQRRGLKKEQGLRKGHGRRHLRDGKGPHGKGQKEMKGHAGPRFGREVLGWFMKE